MGKFTKTPYLVLFIILGAIGVGTASAMITITLAGNVMVTGDLNVDGQLTGPTITQIDNQITNLGGGGILPLDQTVSVSPGSNALGCEETKSCYLPFTVQIGAEGTVTWVNDDSAAHTVTAGTVGEGPSGEFDSSLFASGTTFSHSFEFEGIFPYFCMVHPWMVGQVIVGHPAEIAADVECLNCITRFEIAPNTITSGEIDSDAITTSEILDGTIQTQDLDPDVFNKNEIANWNSRVPQKNNSFIIQDNADNQVALTIGMDGLAVMAYQDSNFDLRVTKCHNSSCTSASSLLVDDSGNVGYNPSIAMAQDGNPIISYRESASSGGDLKFAHCSFPNCSSSTINVLAMGVSQGSDHAGSLNPITIDHFGLPVISYYDAVTKDLKVAKCDTLDCSNISKLYSVDSVSPSTIPITSSIAKTAISKSIIISYYESNLGDLKVAVGNLVSAPSTYTVDSTGDVGQDSAITIGVDGLPVISYIDNTNQSLKVAKCEFPPCFGPTFSTLYDEATVISHNGTSITLNQYGFPVITSTVWFDWDSSKQYSYIFVCGDISCSKDAGDLLGYFNQTSIAIGSDGLPIITHTTNTPAAKVLKCGDPYCQGYWTRP